MNLSGSDKTHTTMCPIYQFTQALKAADESDLDFVNYLGKVGAQSPIQSYNDPSCDLGKINDLAYIRFFMAGSYVMRKVDEINGKYCRYFNDKDVFVIGQVPEESVINNLRHQLEDSSIQIIRLTNWSLGNSDRYFETLKAATISVTTFDLTLSKCFMIPDTYDHGKYHVYATDDFCRDYNNNEVNLCGKSNRFTKCWKRLEKYVKRGFKIGKENKYPDALVDNVLVNNGYDNNNSFIKFHDRIQEKLLFQMGSNIVPKEDRIKLDENNDTVTVPEIFTNISKNPQVIGEKLKLIDEGCELPMPLRNRILKSLERQVVYWTKFYLNDLTLRNLGIKLYDQINKPIMVNELLRYKFDHNGLKINKICKRIFYRFAGFNELAGSIDNIYGFVELLIENMNDNNQYNEDPKNIKEHLFNPGLFKENPDKSPVSPTNFVFDEEDYVVGKNNIPTTSTSMPKHWQYIKPGSTLVD